MATQAALILALVIVLIISAPVAFRYFSASRAGGATEASGKHDIARIGAMLTACMVLCLAVALFGRGVIAPEIVAGLY